MINILVYIYTHVSVYNSNLLGMLNNVHQQFNPWAIINYSQYISTFAGIVLGIFVNMGISDIGYNNKCIYKWLITTYTNPQQVNCILVKFSQHNINQLIGVTAKHLSWLSKYPCYYHICPIYYRSEYVFRVFLYNIGICVDIKWDDPRNKISTIPKISSQGDSTWCNCSQCMAKVLGKFTESIGPFKECFSAHMCLPFCDNLLSEMGIFDISIMGPFAIYLFIQWGYLVQFLNIGLLVQQILTPMLHVQNSYQQWDI